MSDEIVVSTLCQSVVNNIFNLVSAAAKSGKDKKSLKTELDEIEFICCDYEDKYSDVAYILLQNFKKLLSHKLENINFSVENNNFEQKQQQNSKKTKN